MLLIDEVNATTNPRFHALNAAIVQLVRRWQEMWLTAQIDEQNLVSFMPLDSGDEDSIGFVLSHLDNILYVAADLSVTDMRRQYGESEVRPGLLDYADARRSRRSVLDACVLADRRQEPKDLDEGDFPDEPMDD